MWLQCSEDGEDMLQFEKSHLRKRKGRQQECEEGNGDRLTRCTERGDFAESVYRERPWKPLTHTFTHAQNSTVSELHSQTLESLNCCAAPTSLFSLSFLSSSSLCLALLLCLWPWGFNQQCLTALFAAVCCYAFSPPHQTPCWHSIDKIKGNLKRLVDLKKKKKVQKRSSSTVCTTSYNYQG